MAVFIRKSIRRHKSHQARVSKIRVTDASGAYRVIYVARLEAAVYVLHAFRKKTQTTSMHDIDTAKLRFAQISRGAK